MRPIDYLKADIAARYGMDKQSFEDRLLFTNLNIDDLESKTVGAKEPILYSSSVRALRDIQNGKPSGHGVMFDCSASGMQLLSIITGDANGARISNVTGQDITDPYLELYKVMQEKVGQSVAIDRDDLKQAIMTSLYGSEAEPQKLFAGVSLEAFYETMEQEIPNCWELNQFFIDFQKTSTALSYDWVMPDNFHVHCPVTEVIEQSVSCLGSNHLVATKVNQAHGRNRSLGANTVHSIEAFIARELIRRCSFNDNEKIDALLNGDKYVGMNQEDWDMCQTLWDLYKKSGFLSARILDHVGTQALDFIDKDEIYKVWCTTTDKPFAIKAIHDCFSCHPNYAKGMLDTYRELYALLSESNILEYILKQSIDPEIKLNVTSMADDIRKSVYILS